jgi:hypothetical protein
MACYAKCSCRKVSGSRRMQAQMALTAMTISAIWGSIVDGPTALAFLPSTATMPSRCNPEQVMTHMAQTMLSTEMTLGVIPKARWPLASERTRLYCVISVCGVGHVL